MKRTLAKGEQYVYLDYRIRNCANNDGIVLSRINHKSGYECHLGNYGADDLDNVEMAAIVFFMIARPERFATSIMHKVMATDSGCMHEWYNMVNACKEEGLEMPDNITASPLNALIYHNHKPLNWRR